MTDNSCEACSEKLPYKDKITLVINTNYQSWKRWTLIILLYTGEFFPFQLSDILVLTCYLDYWRCSNNKFISEL